MEREGTHEEFMKRCIQLARHAKEQCLSLVGPSFFLWIRKIWNYFLNWPWTFIMQRFPTGTRRYTPSGIYSNPRYGKRQIIDILIDEEEGAKKDIHIF